MRPDHAADEDDEAEAEQEIEAVKPIVVLVRDGYGYAARIDPPLPSGDHQVFAATKDGGWQAARELWQRFGLGLRDESNATHGLFVDRE